MRNKERYLSFTYFYSSPGLISRSGVLYYISTLFQICAAAIIIDELHKIYISRIFATPSYYFRNSALLMLSFGAIRFRPAANNSSFMSSRNAVFHIIILICRNR
jgi:hypothetical protein